MSCAHQEAIKIFWELMISIKNVLPVISDTWTIVQKSQLNHIEKCLKKIHIFYYTER